MGRNLLIGGLLTGVWLASTAPVSAGSSGLGKITFLTANRTVFFLYTNGARSSPPACATVTDRWVIDPSTPGAQTMISTILSAQAQGRPLAVYGLGSCTIWTDTETLEHVDVPIP